MAQKDGLLGLKENDPTTVRRRLAMPRRALTSRTPAVDQP